MKRSIRSHSLFFTGLIVAVVLAVGQFPAGENPSAVVGLGKTPVSVVVVDPADNKTLYAGTTKGVFKSTNSGGSWTAMFKDQIRGQ